MSIREKIEGLLKKEKEELKIELSDVPEIFRGRKEYEINKALDKEEELKALSEEIITQLEDSLDEIKDFKDDEDLQVVEDVAQSFYNRRKNLIEDLKLSENLEEHVNDFKSFVEYFNDVSRKEGVVMKRIEKQSGELQSSIQEMIDHSEELEEFLENGYRPVTKMQETEHTTSEIQELQEEIEDTKKEIKELKKSDRENELESRKQELADLRESQEMKEKKELENRKEELKDSKDEKISSINKDISKIERGLKKAIYEVRNNDTDFSGDLKGLEGLMEHEFQKNIDAVDDLEEIEQIIEKNSLLGDRQMQKFREGAENLSDLEEQLKQVSEIEDEIKEVEEELEELDVTTEKEDLEKSIRSIESEIEQNEERVSELEDRLEELRERLDDRVSSFEDSLSRELDADVTISP